MPTSWLPCPGKTNAMAMSGSTARNLARKNTARCRSKPRWKGPCVARALPRPLCPFMAIAFVFPGQGSQDLGMGRELALTFVSAREVFEEVDAALSQNLSKIMWGGAQGNAPRSPRTRSPH